MTTSRMKSRGIMVLEPFSMPFSTPREMMKWHMSINTSIHTMGFQGCDEKVSK